MITFGRKKNKKIENLADHVDVIVLLITALPCKEAIANGGAHGEYHKVTNYGCCIRSLSRSFMKSKVEHATGSMWTKFWGSKRGG